MLLFYNGFFFIKNYTLKSFSLLYTKLKNHRLDIKNNPLSWSVCTLKPFNFNKKKFYIGKFYAVKIYA